MGIEQTLDFGSSTETKNSRQKRDRGIEQTLDFGISKETKNSRQKIDRGGQTIDLGLQQIKKN